VTLSRTQTTLLLNVFALIVAAAVAVAGSFILPERPEIFPGVFRPLAYSPYFVPAVIMFIIRNRTLSLWLLGLYIALAIEMSFQAVAIHSGTYKYAGHESPLGHFGLLFLFSILCLATYVIVELLRKVGKVLSFRTRSQTHRRPN
jgi:hypothetical protein